MQVWVDEDCGLVDVGPVVLSPVQTAGDHVAREAMVVKAMSGGSR